MEEATDRPESHWEEACRGRGHRAGLCVILEMTNFSRFCGRNWI